MVKTERLKCKRHFPSMCQKFYGHLYIYTHKHRGSMEKWPSNLMICAKYELILKAIEAIATKKLYTKHILRHSLELNRWASRTTQITSVFAILLKSNLHLKWNFLFASLIYQSPFSFRFLVRRVSFSIVVVIVGNAECSLFFASFYFSLFLFGFLLVFFLSFGRTHSHTHTHK